MAASPERANGHRNTRIARAAVVLIGAFAALPPAALADRDTECWSQAQIKGAIGQAVTFTSSVALRHDETVTRHYYTRIESGLGWNVSKHVAVGAEYAHLNSRSGDRWELECRASASLTLKWNLGALSLSDRSRVERRIKETASSTRYRNRLTLSGPKVTALELAPYAEAEVFYDLTAERFQKHRLTGGISVGRWRPIGVSIYYTLEGRRRQSEWTDVDVFGTTLTYHF